MGRRLPSSRRSERVRGGNPSASTTGDSGVQRNWSRTSLPGRRSAAVPGSSKAKGGERDRPSCSASSPAESSPAREPVRALNQSRRRLT